MQVSIIGYEAEHNCDHCGRSLRLGVQTNLLGVIGADCLNKMIVANRKRFSGTGKPGAPYIRTLAKLRQHDDWESLHRIGYAPHHFNFEVIP